jgi:hypothetical protein
MPLATWTDKPLDSVGSFGDNAGPGQQPPEQPGSSGATPSSGPTVLPQLAATGSEEEEVLRKIRNLPPELAVLLLSVGALGFALPGIIGTPALIAGGLALWPNAFGRAETWFAKRYPTVHRKSLHQMGRFLADLERRYPQLRNG